jgi:hypothetical protein
LLHDADGLAARLAFQAAAAEEPGARGDAVAQLFEAAARPRPADVDAKRYAVAQRALAIARAGGRGAGRAAPRGCGRHFSPLTVL